MSARRLAATSLLMGLVGGLLAALAPVSSATVAVLRDPQSVVDAAGPDAAVLAVVGALAWLIWSWVVLGLTLTAASTLPGAVGRLAGRLLRGILPAGARQGAVLALGVGLGLGASMAAPAAAANLPAADASASGLDWPRLTVPDWPQPGRAEGPATDPVQPPAPPPPAAPSAPADEAHVVVRGDCLWTIAAGRLRVANAGDPSDREVAAAVLAWWEINRAIIGPDPDLLLPGQVLRPPVPH